MITVTVLGSQPLSVGASNWDTAARTAGLLSARYGCVEVSYQGRVVSQWTRGHVVVWQG